MESIDGGLIRWPDRRSGPFIARLKLGQVGDRLEVVEVTIGSVRGNRIISGGTLRDARVAELAAHALGNLQLGAADAQVGPGELLNAGDMPADFHRHRADFWAGAKAEAERLAPMIEASLSGTGRRYPAGHLQRVADIYSRARQLHQHPTKSVANALSISFSAAAKQVHRAREAHLLPPTTQGKAESPRSAPQDRRKQ